MERNDGNESGLQGDQGSTGANEFSGSGSPSSQSGSGASGFDFSNSTSSVEQQGGLTDRARNVVGNASGKLADVGSTVRDKAGMAKEKLATALEAGAGRLRDRSAAGALAGATADGSIAIQNDGKVAQVSDRVAGGMERSAEWLRDVDLDDMKSGIESQVKEHPGRTLLIAVGLGYLLGRAFRGNQ